jgi:hypothetical protein
VNKMRRWARSARLLAALAAAGAVLCGCSPARPYMKMNPPADVDKAFSANNGSCWMATASNMLAGAGYGDGATVQERADDIYGDMIAHYGTGLSGWIDTALDWWLHDSGENTWTTNPYTVITVDGNKNPRYPWAKLDGAQLIGNRLRACNFVGLSISWPTNEAGIVGSGGHAFTAWGDEDGVWSTLLANPAEVRTTDSDSETGGDVQVYQYDRYTNPNPGGANEGNGWYIDYNPNHPYIKHIVTLSPTDDPSDGVRTQRVVGSYSIHQTEESSATDLHYRVGTDTTILSYWTRTSWMTDTTPAITESTPRTELQVNWDFSDTPVAQCQWVTITTEFVLPLWNAMEYEDVHFTYLRDADELFAPSIGWRVDTPFIEKAMEIPDVTGGYFIGAFDIVDRNAEPESREYVLGRYRLLHQYSYVQDPEYHVFAAQGKGDLALANVRFGHSYGYLDAESLWAFDQWMTEFAADQYYGLDSEEPVEIVVDWEGRLPYPQGEDITGMLPDLEKAAGGATQ